MLRLIDLVIDRITMYRLLLYYLIGLLVAAVGLSIAGILHYNPIDIVVSSVILVLSAWGINRMLALIFKAPVNAESSLITGLILALIITPSLDKFSVLFMLAAAGLAMASKYLLTVNRKHIFNPAAVAVVLTAFGAQQTASWWVGTAAMVPFVVVGGVLLVRKLRHSDMLYVYFAVTAFSTALFAFLSGGDVLAGLEHALLSSAVLFLGFVMLTEPLTSPPTFYKQLWYAALVGALLPPQVHIGTLYSSPELALIVGNVFAYLISPKTKLFPVLQAKEQVAAGTYDFVFDPIKRLRYRPGQYMEWTLPHTGADSRGVRRYFTLASSPTEPDVRIGVKFYDKSSSFKHALLEMDKETPIVAAQLAGDFTLPRNKTKKLAFIAGGIGVTPFRSMTKYLMDTDDHRSVVMLYSARTKEDVAYKLLFEEARQKLGMKTVYFLSNEEQHAAQAHTYTGVSITQDLIRQEVPDYLERIFYISGTHPMVLAMQDALSGLGVPQAHIKIDFFPGYA